MSGFSPLKLPAPVGYGYMGGEQAPFNAQFAYNMGEVPQFKPPMQPDQVSREMGFDPGRQPDVLSIASGRGDRAIVGELLKLVETGQSQLKAVTPDLARQFLEHWGYPTKANDWTYDEWAEAIAASAPAPTQVGY